MAFFLIISMIGYFILSIALTKKIIVRFPEGSKRRLALIGAIVFFSLFPTWDAVIGYPIYKYYCMTWAGQEIYKTVESEGIYYEGRYPLSDIGGTVFISGADDDLRDGFRFVESKSTVLRSSGHNIKEIPPTTYRCEWKGESATKIDYRDMNCYQINEPASRYAVTVKRKGFLTFGSYSISVNDRANNELLGEKRNACIGYLGLGPVPFFNWLEWYDRGKSEYCCIDAHMGFELNVIQPIKSVEGSNHGKYVK